METFTSASAFPQATLPSAPSSDDFTSRKIDELDNPRLLRETDKKNLFNNPTIQHHLETFTSSSALPHATLPNAPSLDYVTCRELDDLDKLRLLCEADEQINLIKQLKI